MDILSIIPARGGSKGIPRKNINLLAGHPLLYYTAKSSLEANSITRTILSTDDPEIASIGLSLGLEVPFLRPSNLSHDSSSTISAVLHLLEQLRLLESYIPDFIVILQPTSPFRTSHHVDEAIKLLLQTHSSSLVSVSELPHNHSPHELYTLSQDQILEPLFPDYTSPQNRHKKPIYYSRNGAAIYITKTSWLLSCHSFFSPCLVGYRMSKLDSIDIDDADDWLLAQLLMSYKDHQ